MDEPTLYTYGHTHTSHTTPSPPSLALFYMYIRPFHLSLAVLPHAVSSRTFSLLTTTITFYEPKTTTSSSNNNIQPPLYRHLTVCPGSASLF